MTNIDVMFSILYFYLRKQASQIHLLQQIPYNQSVRGLIQCHGNSLHIVSQNPYHEFLKKTEAEPKAIVSVSKNKVKGDTRHSCRNTDWLFWLQERAHHGNRQTIGDTPSVKIRECSVGAGIWDSGSCYLWLQEQDMEVKSLCSPTHWSQTKWCWGMWVDSKYKFHFLIHFCYTFYILEYVGICSDIRITTPIAQAGIHPCPCCNVEERIMSQSNDLLLFRLQWI